MSEQQTDFCEWCGSVLQGDGALVFCGEVVCDDCFDLTRTNIVTPPMIEFDDPRRCKCDGDPKQCQGQGMCPKNAHAQRIDGDKRVKQ